MFSEEKLSRAGQKSSKVFTQVSSYGFEYKKAAGANCLLRCSLKKLEAKRPLLTEYF